MIRYGPVTMRPMPHVLAPDASPPTASPPHAAGPGHAARHAGVDRLRAGTTLLVVCHHTAITYGAMGGWYYQETPPDGSLTSMLLVFFCTVNQAWFMGLFFLLAGYYSPGALAAKGWGRFVRDRLLRLGLPLLFYGLVLGPATVALARTAQGRPFGVTLLRLWGEGVFEKGPLWFAWALLLLTAVALLVGAVRSGWGGGAEAGGVAPARRRFHLPSDGHLLALALATGALAFGLRLLWPVGQERWGIQWGYTASYGVLFAVGWWAGGASGLAPWPPQQVRRWRRVAAVTLPVLALVALGGGPLWGETGRPEGGWTVPALVYAFWEPLVAWGVLLTLLQRARARPQASGWLGRSLARRAFAIYVVHPPVVVAVCLAWRTVAAPPGLKFVVSAAVACVLCHALAGALLRVPALRRVF